MKKLYLIPGYKHTLTTPGYRELMLSLERWGYKSEFIPISWEYRVMSDYIQEANDAIQISWDDIILWFSFGAMIALQLAEQSKCKQVILCSLSPYFSEDLKTASKYSLWKLWIRRYKDFLENYLENSIVNSQDNLYTVIYGTSETQNLQRRNQKIIEKLSIENVWLVSWVGHNIAHKEYQKTILKHLI